MFGLGEDAIFSAGALQRPGSPDSDINAYSKVHAAFRFPRAMTGEGDYKAGCETIASLGPDVVVCKRGEEGAYMVSAEGAREFHPPGGATVVDNTGAGDVFDAGFLAGLLLGRDVDDYLAFAHAVAVKSLGGYGRERYPDAEDLKKIQGG